MYCITSVTRSLTRIILAKAADKVFDMKLRMQPLSTRTPPPHVSTILICVGLSLLVHSALALLLLQTAQQTDCPKKQQQSTQRRTVLITRTDERNPNKGNQPEQEQPLSKPFVKTDAERPQQKPNQADFEGQRNAKAEGMGIEKRRNDAPLPTMAGEDKEEINPLHQERQDGDVEFYGTETAETRPQTISPNEIEQDTPTAPHTPQPPTGQTEATDTAARPEATPTPPKVSSATDAQSPESAHTENGLKLKSPQEQETADTASAALGQPNSAGNTPVTSPTVPATPARRPVYDPTQAQHAQPPGLRTTERRSRSTGQFVIGKMPSCNVEATPRGQYEELVYRLIAKQWYFACDQHRGDIIPGTIIISVRINSRGQTVSMTPISRRGAGVSQQSFTFAAIRRAQFPAMPEAVRKTLIGDLMELIITFDFN